MLRKSIIMMLALTAACTPAAAPKQGAEESANSGVSTPADLSADPADKLPGSEPETSPKARAAVILVQQYLDHLAAKRYRAAWRLWGNGGADSKGTAEQFADSFALYADYRGEAVAPTAIRARDGSQYISVAANVHVKLKKNGEEQERSGNVLLRRSMDPKAPPPDGQEWRIWGTDIRPKN